MVDYTGGMPLWAQLVCGSFVLAGAVTGWALTRGMTKGKRWVGRVLGAAVGLLAAFIVVVAIYMQPARPVPPPPIPTAAPSYVSPTDTYIPPAETHIPPSPGQRPTARPTLRSLRAQGCIRWDEVHQSYVGSDICVFGIIASVSASRNPVSLTIQFSQYGHNFKIQDSNHTYIGLETGMCISVHGTVVDNGGFLMLRPDKDENTIRWYSDTSNCQ